MTVAITLVLADDHPILLEGLRRLFAAERDLEVLACCHDGETTLRAVREHRPAILVLDVRMPGLDGVAVLRELHRDGPPTRTVLLTAAVDEREVHEAIRLGARGVVLKEMAPALLVRCIRTVHEGSHWFERRSYDQMPEGPDWGPESTRHRAFALTSRELGITRMVARGLRNREIAGELSIAEGTVKIHLHHIYEKLEVDGRLALAVYAREKGIA